MLLIVGGTRDPNVDAIHDTCRHAGQECVNLRVGQDEFPSIQWNLTGCDSSASSSEAETKRGADEASPQFLLPNKGQGFRDGVLIINGQPIIPTSAFIRFDVFEYLRDARKEIQHRASAWFSTLIGYFQTKPDLRLLNRNGLTNQTNKLSVLHHAMKLGLPIPRSVVSNDADWLRRFTIVDSSIVKPVNGGDYCKPLDELLSKSDTHLGKFAAPGIIQEKLVGPEYRVFIIGRKSLVFSIHSNQLDYRTDTSPTIICIEDFPQDLLVKSHHLAHQLGLNFAALDFKSNQKGEPVFLEINSSPMFAAFDQVVESKISQTILAWLLQPMYLPPHQSDEKRNFVKGHHVSTSTQNL